MYLTAVVVYVPTITTFLGDHVVLPGQIWRLAWPIPLAALLALGWLTWEVTGRVASSLGRFGSAQPLTRPLARALPLLVVAALTIGAVPPTREGLESVLQYKEDVRLSGFYPVDPIYPWFRDELDSPRVVLASDLLSARIPAYSSDANVVSRRGSLLLKVLPKLKQRAPGRIEVPQGSLDVQKFFHGTDFRTRIDILRRHEVDYVMVPADSQLGRSLDQRIGFERVREPSPNQDLYAVDLQSLGWLQAAAGQSRVPPR
jgi:hypothetical protein